MDSFITTDRPLQCARADDIFHARGTCNVWHQQELGMTTNETEARRIVDRLHMVARHVAASAFIPDEVWSKPLHMRHRTRACRFLAPGHDPLAVAKMAYQPEKLVAGDPEPVDYGDRTDAEDAALYKWWRHAAADDATRFADAIFWAAAHEPEIFEPRNLDAIEDEMLDVLQHVVDDPSADAARQSVRAWIRSRGNLDEPTDALSIFARHLASAGTLKAITPKTGQVVVGVDAIAAETRRSVRGTLRLISNNKLPVAHVAGRPCSTQDLLRPHRDYHTALAA
jgi:hypothetical protein